MSVISLNVNIGYSGVSHVKTITRTAIFPPRPSPALHKMHTRACFLPPPQHRSRDLNLFTLLRGVFSPHTHLYRVYLLHFINLLPNYPPSRVQQPALVLKIRIASRRSSSLHRTSRGARRMGCVVYYLTSPQIPFYCDSSDLGMTQQVNGTAKQQ